MRKNTRFLRGMAKREASAKVETYDGLVYDLNLSAGTCRVKIYSDDNAMVTAKFPLNTNARPTWLLPGTVVQITRIGGIRSYFYVSGRGLSKPQSAVNPTTATAEDSVISGMDVMAFYDLEIMAIWVRTGTYRIAGTEYELEAIPLGEDPPFYLGGQVPLGSLGAALTIDSCSTGYSRYDIIVCDVDGLVSVTKGTRSIVEPTMPDTPADHVLCGYVLVRGSITYISGKLINCLYEASLPTLLKMDISEDDYLTWGDASDVDIKVTVYDQFVVPLRGTGTGHQIELEFLFGNGILTAPGAGSSSTSVTGYSGTDDDVDFTYNRNNLPTDISPVFKATLEGIIPLTTMGFLKILDEYGVPMSGGQSGETWTPALTDI